MENAPDCPGGNRREPRTPRRVLTIRVYGHTQEEQAILIDCSPAGVTLLFDRAVIPNASIMLKLGHATDSPIAAYEVRHHQEVPDGHLIEAHFLGFIGEADAALDGQAACQKLLSL